MLSDEEKKAIESFKEENNNDLSRFDDFNSYTQFKVKRDKIIINLIEKQSKEIERLKEVSKECIEEKFNNDNKWEDKIKAKIEELDKQEEDLQNSISDEEREEYSDANISWKLMDIQIRREVLQSLLEKE